MRTVPVGDTDEAIRFFCDVLGMEKKTDAPMGDGNRYVEVAVPGTDTVLAPYTWHDREEARATIGEYSRVVFRCDDVRATHADLKSKGVELVGEPFTGPGGYFAGMRDPWGNFYVLAGNRDITV